MPRSSKYYVIVDANDKICAMYDYHEIPERHILKVLRPALFEYTPSPEQLKRIMESISEVKDSLNQRKFEPPYSLRKIVVQ